MNTRIFLPVFLAAAVAGAQPAPPDAASAKPDNPPAAPAAEKTEMQKWIEATDVQWQAAFKRDVTDVHEAELNKVKLQYLTSLEDGIKKASSANDLKGALALRNEQKRFGDTNVFPEKDEEGDVPALKAIRAAIRVQLAKLEKDSAVRAKALHAKFDQVLAQAQAQLTKSQRLDDALLVQNKRDEVTAAWITPAVAAAAENANPPAAPPVTNVQKPATPAKVPFGTQPVRDLKATIPANSPDGFSLGEVRKGSKITLQYVAGKWKAWGVVASYSPDQETKMERGDISRLAIALPRAGSKGGDVVAVVPANTVQSPFVFEAQKDYPKLVLRINDRENSFAENPGSVEYSVKITPPSR